MRTRLDTESRWMRLLSRCAGRGAGIRTLALTQVFMVVFMVIFLLGSAAGVNAAPFRAHYAGTVTTTELDLNGDEEEMARTSQGVGKGTLIGPFVFHEIRESDDLEPGHPDNRCGAGEIERIEIHWTAVFTDQNGKNQLFFQLADDQPHMICIDPSSPPVGGLARRHDFSIIGGTNRFDGATGRVTTTCSGRVLVLPQPGFGASGPGHGSVACDMSGVINLTH